jgi:endonuclease YncB( thermonuclease family)
MDSPRSRFTFLLLPLLIFIFALASHAYIRTVEGFVQKEADGDTVTLVTHDGVKLRVRLYGIDAPEVRHEKKPGQLYGEEAKRALTGKVLLKEVAPMIQDTDRYKRVVGIIKIGIRNINEEMVREGWAWAFREYLRGPYVSEFINAEREAREKKLELWQQSNLQPPWEFRAVQRGRLLSWRSAPSPRHCPPIKYKRPTEVDAIF